MGFWKSAAGMAVAWLALLPMSIAAASGLATAVDSDGGTFHLVLKPLTVPVPFNDLFELQVDVSLLKALDDPNPLWIDVATTMPGHGHGMNTRTRIDGPQMQGKSGRFIVRGLLLHMQGEWEFAFDVAKGRTHEKAKVRFVLE